MNETLAKEGFGTFLYDTIDQYLSDFRSKNLEYKDLQDRIDSLLEILKKSSDSGILNELLQIEMGCIEIISDYMYTRGLRDGLKMMNYLEDEFIREEFLSIEKNTINPRRNIFNLDHES